MKQTVMLAALLFAGASVGALQAAPVNKHSTMGQTTNQATNMRVAAGEKKEVEGTKADAREDKAEAAAQANSTPMHHAKAKHRRHKASTGPT